MENEEIKKEYSNIKEVIRFLIVGVIATIFDLLTKLIINSVIGDNLKNLKSEQLLKTFIGYTCGFIIGVIINYLLSTFWVFKNVKNKKESRSAKGILLFLFFSLLGFLIGLGITYGLGYLILYTSKINIIDFSLLPTDGSSFWTYFINCLSNANFWAYIGVFCIQTIIVLVWNYLTRKKFIFKSPKNEENSNKNNIV